MDQSVGVLLVDPDPGYAEQVGAYLEADGRFDVETATDPSTVLDRIHDGVDCVVSGHEPPAMDGLVLLEDVRDRHPDLPFVLYTGQGSEALASDAISAGVTDYLRTGEDDETHAVLANRVASAVEQYRARQRLAESEQRLSLFVEQSPIGVIEWDEQFEFRRMNDAARDILGYTEAELRGDNWETIVPEGDRPAVERVVADLLENQGGYHSVNENVRANGERITCEWHNRVITNDEGETVTIVSQFQDVTERKRQERALAESEARYESMTEDVLDTSEVGTVVVDDASDVVWINAAIEEYIGVEREAMLGTSVPDAIDEVMGIFAEPEQFRRRLLSAYEANDDVEEFECHVLPGDGRDERWLRHWSQPIETGLYAGGRISHYTDVTDQKKRSQQLEAMDRVLRHNLHNAMTVIMGNAETIAAADDGDLAARAEMIRESGTELLEVTSKQRQIVELLSEPPDVGTVDVSAVVRANVDRVVSRHDGVEVDLRVPDGVTAQAIPQLEDAVRELVENAVVHATDPDPQVSVRVETTADGLVRITVTDEGTTIPIPERAILRGEGEGGPLYHGSGMGLWLVNWVVTYSNGTVTYAENDPRGNVVTIELSRDGD